MPRGRMLNKKISYDEKIIPLSLESKLLFSWMIPHLDQKGRFFADSNIIKGQIVPFVKEISMKKIQKCLVEMEEQNLIVIYGNTQKYLEFVGFTKNQTINEERETASIIPPPTEAELQSNSGVTPQQYKYNINTIQYKGEIGVVFDYFLLKTKKKFHLDDTRRKIILGRLKEGRTVEDMKLAIDNFCADDWVDRPKHMDLQYCLGTKNKINNLDKWLNRVPQKKKRELL